MFKELPGDIWFDIIHKHLRTTYDVSPTPFFSDQRVFNLALTCKGLREIALPVLYHSLLFEGVSDVRSDSENRLKSLTHVHARARCLQRCGHLLRHVRELHLESWSIEDTNDDLVDEYSGNYLDLHSLVVSTVYDAVTSLVAHMSDLRYLVLFASPITSSLHYAAQGHHLESLILSNPQKTRVPAWHTPLEPSIALHLRHLTYNETWPSSDKTYFHHILKHCVQHLVTLRMEWQDICELHAIVSNRTLSLEQLSVEGQCNGAELISAMSSLLLHCPNLRIFEDHQPPHVRPVYEMQALPSGSLPKLETLICRHHSMAEIAAGRTLHSLEIMFFYKVYHSNVLLKHVLRYSTEHLESLSLIFHIESFQHLLTFLRGLSPLTGLTLLYLTVEVKSWRKFRQAITIEVPLLFLYSKKSTKFILMPKQIPGIVGDIIAKWPHLREFQVVGTRRKYDLDMLLCPVSTGHDGTPRGHPSLESLIFLGDCDHPWVWGDMQGWTC